MSRVAPYIRIASGDLISKFIIVGINLYLIRFLNIDQYSHYSLLINAIFLGYQLACGPLERLFIAEHSKYVSYLKQLQWLFCTLSSLFCLLWIWHEIAIIDSLLIVIGIFILAEHQTLKIQFQQRLSFTAFSVAEILKNASWLILLTFIISTSNLSPSLGSVIALLIGTSVSLFILSFIANKKVNTLKNHKPSWKFIPIFWDSRYVITYSLIGAMIPYLPLAMASAIATATNNNTITATYGASMRYQAILGMFVFAFNTVLLPQMAAISDNHKEQLKLRNNLKRIAPWAFFSYSVITISIWSFIPYIDNGKYPDLPTIFLIMAITPGLSLIGTPYINKLLIAGMARTVLLCMSCGLIANLLIFFIFDSKNELTPALGSLFAYLVITISLISFEVARNRKSCLK